ncbi:MAG: 6-bladed beta-propeller [Coriobacteriia bacterium]|nr:6-bladed beta-propeller [Coriobacteriia bacterium]
MSPPGPRGLYLTPRQAFLTMAGVLAVVLVSLVVYLWWLTRPADFTVEADGESQGGLVPKLTIYGPGREPAAAFDQPMGAAWGRDGTTLFVADALNNRICVFDAQGRPVREFGSLGVAKPLAGAERTWDPGELSYPVDVAVAEDGTVYVADFYNDSISAFTEQGRFIRRFPDPYAPTGKGSSGAEGGGIAVTAVAAQGGRVYATDTYQVLVFDTEGKLLNQFGQPGMGPEGLNHPGGIAVDRDGRIYVSDSNHNRVKAYSPEGELLWVSGRPVSGLQSKTDNPFVLPRGMTVLRDGSILVADPLAHQLVRLDRDGKVVAQYGVRGTLDGQLNFPNDVAVRDQDVLVADRQNQRIQVVNLSSR